MEPIEEQVQTFLVDFVSRDIILNLVVLHIVHIVEDLLVVGFELFFFIDLFSWLGGVCGSSMSGRDNLEDSLPIELGDFGFLAGGVGVRLGVRVVIFLGFFGEGGVLLRGELMGD